ncbi:serine hydrolase domain-containing protein [Halomicroarcula sp. GCM10025709]|uniref:serine hydrolase domain-containing protein n=1 Tax=Haloarcula TaxID=2237 RepID=UPI0024C3905A|nr:serine hydrolase domain-containing protein [Halomicroarcula sp. YJ-61-S]
MTDDESSESAKENPEYSVPAELTPVSKWAKGFTADQVHSFRNDYEARNFVLGDDIGVFFNARASEVVPASIIYRSGRVSSLESEPMSEITEVVATSALGTMPLREAMDDPRARFQSIAVVHEGKLVLEEYRGMRENENHIWNSTAKTLSGLLIHILEEDGLIDLNKPVTAYVPEWEGTDWEKVRVSQVLHQRSGMDFVENNENVRNPKHPVSRAFSSALAARDEPQGESINDLLTEVVLKDEPGTVFDYSTFNTQVLGIIIEKVTKKPFDVVLSERIWSPAGMEGDALLVLTPSGEPLNGGIFGSRLRDFARYGMLFTPSWREASDTRIVSDSYFEKLHESADKSIYLNGGQGPRMVEEFGSGPTAAAYQWDAIFEDGDLYKAGRNGNCLYVSPETDTVVVWFSTTYENSLWLSTYARSIVNQHFRDR